MTSGYGALARLAAATGAGSSSSCGPSRLGWRRCSSRLLRSELAPLEDRGVIFGRMQSPPGATVEYTSEQLRPVESYFETIPEAAAYNAIAGFPTVDFGTAVLRLKPWEERKRKQQDIARELNQQFQSLPGIIGFAVNPPSLGQSRPLAAGRIRDHGAAALRGARSHRAELHRRNFEDRDRA